AARARPRGPPAAGGRSVQAPPPDHRREVARAHALAPTTLRHASTVVARVVHARAASPGARRWLPVRAAPRDRQELGARGVVEVTARRRALGRRGPRRLSRRAGGRGSPRAP